jgi:iron complex outermembrane receptor protein
MDARSRVFEIPDSFQRSIPGYKRRLLRAVAILLLATMVSPPIRSDVAKSPGDADVAGSEGAERGVGDEEQPVADTALVEKVTVTTTRLALEPAPVEEVPNHVSVIDKERIEQSGVNTLQDLLLYETGAVVHDQVGNNIQKTFDLRGFTGGTTTNVFLDGAPLNDARNNMVALDLVPLSSLERVEITRGSITTQGGGGAMAGVINLVPRRSEELSGSLALSGGSFGTGRVGGEVGGTLGRVGFYLTGGAEETDGFRQNAGGERRQLAGSVGLDVGASRRLELSFLDSASDLGNPGALTAEEIDDDPAQAPFNRLDFTDQRLGQAALNFRGGVTRSLALAANLFVRDRSSEILTTGRSAELFGGFGLDLMEAVIGTTVQLTHSYRAGSMLNELTGGAEWSDGTTDARGISTPADDPGLIDPNNVASLNATERTTRAVYIQDRWRPNDTWSLTFGLRADRDELGYRESSPDPTNNDSRSFSELSGRIGANWNPREQFGLYASISDAFLPPTVEQLFAFPTFFSNPDLEPEDSRSYELGVRNAWGSTLSLNAALFLTDVENEILFDPAAGLFGGNVNAGETRRTGIELALRGRPSRRYGYFVNLTLLDAEFRNGPNRGNAIPQVPRELLAAGFDVGLTSAWRLHVDGFYVGEQALSNDEANEQRELPAYAVADLRLVWRPELLTGRSPTGRSRGGSLFAQVNNVFDEQYATRGIYAAFLGDAFVNPAPGRNYLLGARWDF